MTKLAQFNAQAAQPTPVIGWFDTDEFDYPNLPAETELIALTDAEWSARVEGEWHVLAGALVPKPAPTAEQQLIIAQTQQLALLATAYAAAIQQPVAYLDTLFQADEASQIVLTKVLVVGAVPDGFFWLDANNQPVPMTFAQLQGLAAAMLAQGQAAFAKLQQLKSAVRAAATIDAVAAVVWQ